jgi:hypothetical protein
MSKYLFFLLFVLFFACQNDAGLPDLDLVKYGVGIKIKAPQDAEVKVSDMGIMKDISVKGGKGFYIQILNSEAINYSAEKLKEEELADVKKERYFSKVIQEDANGFLFEKDYGDEKVNYDFRFFKILGDQEYKFQTGLIGNFSEEDVRIMYEAIQ